MNVELLDEARLDIADGVAFYDRQSDGAGDYFFQRIFGGVNAAYNGWGIVMGTCETRADLMNLGM